ncbi:MAG: thioredoxin family protein [Gammaproteobacteria bacterium]|nr:thioredoxin family protein [Gammaproteobacteria bacterium]
MINILFLTVPNCVQCAKAKHVIDKVKTDYPDMVMEEINIIEHPEILEKYHVMSSPGIVINGKLEYSGGLDEVSFREKLSNLSSLKGSDTHVS